MKRFWGVLCSLLMMSMLALPAFAGGPRQMTKEDLKGISAHRYRYLFTTVGGAAVGAGIMSLFGGGGNILKGVMIGGGGGSSLYLHSHPHDNLNGWRNWAVLGSHTALAGGAGWTLCGCDDGLVAGSLIGGGATAWWQASHGSHAHQTASTNQP